MIVCPHCQNDDIRLMEPRILFLATWWQCLVCSKGWKERRVDGSDARPAPVSE
jgi:hypothetical protein